MLRCRCLLRRCLAAYCKPFGGYIPKRLGGFARSRDRLATGWTLAVRQQQGPFKSVPLQRHTIYHKGAGRKSLQAAANSSSAAPSTQKELKLQHILVSIEQRELYTRLQEQLQEGTPFEDLAKKHSSCPSASSGGDLGWVSRNMGMHPALEEAIFGTQTGGFAPVEAADGLHLFKVAEERQAPMVQIMTVTELEGLLKEGPEAAQFIDVREKQEHDIASLPHFQLLPLSRFQEWAPKLRESFDPDKPTVCLCHAGVRSLQVANLLLGQGFTKVHNVSGGIEAYSCFIDGTVPRY